MKRVLSLMAFTAALCIQAIAAQNFPSEGKTNRSQPPGANAKKTPPRSTSPKENKSPEEEGAAKHKRANQYGEFRTYF